MTKRAILKSTQIQVALTLTVVSTRQDDTRLAILPIIHLTGLIMLLWGFGNWLNRIAYELSALALDCQQALDFTVKVLAIGFSALAYGVGVS